MKVAGSYLTFDEDLPPCRPSNRFPNASSSFARGWWEKNKARTRKVVDRACEEIYFQVWVDENRNVIVDSVSTMVEEIMLDESGKITHFTSKCAKKALRDEDGRIYTNGEAPKKLRKARRTFVHVEASSTTTHVILSSNLYLPPSVAEEIFEIFAQNIARLSKSGQASQQAAVAGRS